MSRVRPVDARDTAAAASWNCALDGRPRGEGRVEAPGEFRRHRVIDRMRSRDHGRCARLEQPDDLRVGRAAVEENELEPAAAAEEGGQSTG